jgi:hypothetical protein
VGIVQGGAVFGRISPPAEALSVQQAYALDG